MMKQSEILLTGKTRNTTNLRNSGPVALENGSMKANIESYCKLLSLGSVIDK